MARHEVGELVRWREPTKEMENEVRSHDAGTGEELPVARSNEVREGDVLRVGKE